MKRWPTRPLGELILTTGQRDPRERPTEAFSYVDIAGVDNDSKMIVAEKRIVGSDAPSRARKIIGKGDVIVSTVRPNLNAVAIVPDHLDDQICSTGFSVLRPSERVTSGYLFAFVRSPFFINQLVARTTGANYPAVNDGEVKEVSIPVPPLPEQERIVKLLDEADELRKLRAQADRRTAQLIPALFHEMFGDARHKWPTTTVEKLADVKAGFAWKSQLYSQAETDGPAIIRIQNLGGNDNAQIVYYRGDIVPGYWIDAGEILVSLSGSFKAYRWQGRRALLNQRIVAVRPRQQIDGDFLFAVLASRLAEIQDQAMGIAVANASMATVREMQIPVPPLPLQKEFAQRVTEIRAMEAEQAASRQRLDALFQSMLHRAFDGEL
jgi:type I restriction enzyme S subunit